MKLINLIIFLIIVLILFFSFKNFVYFLTKSENIDKYFEDLIEQLNLPLIGYEQDFKIIYFNKAAEEFFDFKKNEILNKIISPKFLDDKKLKPLVEIIYPSLASVVLSVSEPNTWPLINEIVLNDPKKYLKTYTIKLLDKNNNFFCFLKIIQDETREKELINLKNDFISAAAHQTRTPLNAINWAFESLINLNKDKNLDEIIKNGYEASQRALKIVNDLLNISKIEEGKFDYNFQEIELNQYLKKILTFFKDLAKEYEVELYFNSFIDEIKVKIDPDKFGLAISNFIDNAIRYNIKNGKVEINVEKFLEKPYILISIKDTGIGIPEENLKYISQKFYRVENAVQKEPNGSGLGIYISKNIIKQHGGDIRIVSILNRGTTVNIFLPINFSSTEKVKSI